ncbi:hypothetical protein PR001_g25879 [Phytophthora rubi]|nr:hypothetical protein PR002_g26207 [Phytophthora rubi]KAE8974828.1 hypothetical protein PR001_g25879 [Phytophthora rubi]
MEEGRRVGEEEAGANDTERVVEPDADAVPIDIHLHVIVERLREAEDENGCGQVPLKLLYEHTSNDVCKQPDEVGYAKGVGGNGNTGTDDQDGATLPEVVYLKSSGNDLVNESTTAREEIMRSICKDLAATTEIEGIDLHKSTEEDFVWSEGAPDCVPPELDKYRANLGAFAERYVMLVHLLALSAALEVRTVRENAVALGVIPPTVLRV